MLKVVGNIYGSDVTTFEELKEVLEREGYEVAYQTDMSGVVVKEVESLAESENQTA